MPKIPTAKRRRIPSGRVDGVPTPMDIADVGAGIEARGLAALGREIGDLGQYLFRIQQDQQQLIDFEADSKATTLIETTNDDATIALQRTLNKKGEYEKVVGETFDTNITSYWAETQDISDRQRRIIESKFTAGKARAVSNALFASVKKTLNTAWAALELETIDAYASMDVEKQNEAKKKFDEMSIIKYGSDKEGQRVAKAEWDKWIVAGEKTATENAISNVHAAIEAASDPETGTGDFTLARELAKIH